MRIFIWQLFALLIFAQPSFAGNLFPPSGAATGQPCPAGQLLSWTGDGVACAPVIPQYSASCNDATEKGYSDINSCIQDGRWHLVYSHNANGMATFGKIQSLIQHILNGADVKVTGASPRGDFTGAYWTCGNVAINGNLVACLDNLRFSGAMFTGTNEGVGTNGLGTSVKRTDGATFNTVLGGGTWDMKITGENVWANLTTYFPFKAVTPPHMTGIINVDAPKAAMNWYVKF